MDRDYIGACISCSQHFFKLRGGDEYKCAGNSGAGYHWISDISPVSYTHLDVYKRQDITFIIVWIFCLRSELPYAILLPEAMNI